MLVTGKVAMHAMRTLKCDGEYPFNFQYIQMNLLATRKEQEIKGKKKNCQLPTRKEGPN